MRGRFRAIEGKRVKSRKAREEANSIKCRETYANILRTVKTEGLWEYTAKSPERKRLLKCKKYRLIEVPGNKFCGNHL